MGVKVILLWLIFHSVHLSWCYRECNLAVHDLAQHARFINDEFIVWLEDEPDFLNLGVFLAVN